MHGGRSGPGQRAHAEANFASFIEMHNEAHFQKQAGGKPQCCPCKMQ